MTDPSVLDTAAALVDEAVENFATPEPANLKDEPVFSHEIAFQMYRNARKINASYDRHGRTFFKTMAKSKLEPLPTFPMNWERLAQLAYQEIRAFVHDKKNPEKATVGVRVMEPLFTLKNKVRLVIDDPKSPLGTIIKFVEEIDELHKPWACASFKATEAFRYAVEKLPEEPSWLTRDKPSMPKLVD